MRYKAINQIATANVSIILKHRGFPEQGSFQCRFFHKNTSGIIIYSPIQNYMIFISAVIWYLQEKGAAWNIILAVVYLHYIRFGILAAFSKRRSFHYNYVYKKKDL